jgi:hypothetical protein
MLPDLRRVDNERQPHRHFPKQYHSKTDLSNHWILTNGVDVGEPDRSSFQREILQLTISQAIFAIPLDLNVLYIDMEHHGRSWFVGAIFILAVATYTLAIFIGNVLDFFRYPPPQPGAVGKKPRPENPPNIWKWIWLPQFLDLLGQGFHKIFNRLGLGFHAIVNWLLQTEEEDPNPNSPHEKPENQAPVPTNEEKSMEEGKAKVMTAKTKSVQNGDETPNGAVNPVTVTQIG